MVEVSDAAHDDDEVYLPSQPLGLCPDDLPLATGTKLRWSISRQTKMQMSNQTWMKKLK